MSGAAPGDARTELRSGNGHVSTGSSDRTAEAQPPARSREEPPERRIEAPSRSEAGLAGRFPAWIAALDSEDGFPG